MPLPGMLLIKQNLPDRRIRDLGAEVTAQLRRANFASRIPPGSRVAVGVGSRGISNIGSIVGTTVEYWRSAGMHPFIFPAMGSHGAATAEGQARVLAHYGIDERSMGCPVVSALEVVSVGRTPEGIEAFMDKAAFESAGVMLVNRVKWHTDFAGKIESGLFKMMAIGLGKFAGAKKYHTHGLKFGLEQVIRSAGRQVLKSGKILGGLAILEDAHHNTGMVEAVPVETMEHREEELLAIVKSWMARIPVKEVDLLVVDEMGKNISGTGMDTKVINRSVEVEYNPWDTAPQIRRIFVRDLTDLSYGNAVGIGTADVVHDRLLPKIDWSATQVNSLTASTPPLIRVPMHFSSDRECIEKIATTVGKFDLRDVTVAWIRNTLELGTLMLSENLRAEIAANPALQILPDARPLEFDSKGDLVSPFARCSEEVLTQ